MTRSRARAAPWFWRAWVLLVGALGLNCRDSTGPRLATGRLALLPEFESKAASQIDFDRMRVTIVHPAGGAVVDTVISILATVDTIDVSIKVPLTSSSEEFLLYLRLVNAAGDTVLKNDPYPQSVTVTSGGGGGGGPGTPVSVTMRATIASISVTPAQVTFASLGETQQLTAVALDQNGNPLSTQPTNFAWSSSAPAVASVNPATGLVTAVGNGSATISATVSGVSGTRPVTVSQVATQLGFTTPPSTAAAGIVIAPAITVAAQDARGNAVGGFTAAVTVSLGTNPGSSVLTGTTTKSAVAGIAQFADLRLDQPGTQYTLVFSTPSLPPITSIPFDVRAAPATVYWTSPNGGVWSDASKWSTGAVPGSADNAVISVSGNYTVTLDVDATFGGLTIGGAGGNPTLLVPSHTLTLNGAGTVEGNGTLQLNSGVLGGSGQLINRGTVKLSYGTVQASLALRNEALLVLQGSSYLNGPFTTVAGSTLRVLGDYNCCSAYATVASGFTNLGTIELTAINGTGAYADLAVTNGILVNEAGASITALAGTGGPRQLDVQLDNRGTVTLEAATTMSRSASVHLNSGTIDVSGGDLTINQYAYPTAASFSNTGVINVAAGRTFTVSSGEFHYDGGTVGGAGSIAFTNVAVDLGQGLSNAALALSLNSVTVNGPGTLTNAAGKSMVLSYSTINAPLDNQGTLVVHGSGYFNGAITTAAGSVLRMEGDYNCCSAYATVANGFTNNGTIELTSVNGTGNYASLAVTNGTLVNAAGAAINVLPGTGGTRQLDAALDNRGTLGIAAPTTMSRAASVHSNSGTIDINGGDLTVNQYAYPTAASFTTTGTITIAAGRTFTVSSGDFHYDGGTIGGAGSVSFTSATLFLGQPLSNAVVSILLNNATVNGPATLTNASGKALVLQYTRVAAPIDNQGTLTLRGYSYLDGAVTTGTSSVMRAEGDYNCCGSYTTVANGFTNNGLLELTSVNGTGSLAAIVMTNGTLVNASGATIHVLPGAGGTRQLDVQLDNRGTVAIDTTISMGRAASVHSNSGTINVTGGDFTVNQYAYPTAASFTNTGTINVAAARTFTVTSGEFHDDAGVLGGSGTVTFNSATVFLGQGLSNAVLSLNLTSATVNGPGTLTNVGGKTLGAYYSTINAPLDNQGLLVLRGSSYLNGAVTTASGSTVRLEGDYNCCGSYLTVANGFTNNGLIDLTAINGTGSYASLTVTTGTLVNASGASINASAGTGGTRELDVELNNQGTFTVSAPTQMNRAASVHTNAATGTIAISGGNLTINQYAYPTPASFTNNGAITVASGDSLKIYGAPFTQQSGSLGGAGTLALSSVPAANFNSAHTLAAISLLNSTASFTTDQSTASTAFTLNSSVVNGPGVFTNASSGSLALYYSTINATLDNQGPLTLRGSSAINGTLTTSTGSTIRLEGDYNCCGSYATIANGFTNNGTIDLTAVNGTGTVAALTVTNGTLVNAGGASINSLVGTGGTRQLDVALDNSGRVSIQTATTMNRANSAHVNGSGATIDISGGGLTTNQYTGGFTNNGTISVAPSLKWIINNGTFDHNGTLTGGELDLNSVTAANFNAAHGLAALSLNSSTASFATDQSTASTAFTLYNSTVNGPGTLTNASGQTLVMSYGTMNAPLTNQGLLTLRGSTALKGVINTVAGSTLRVEGDPSYSAAFATVDLGFVNNGTIELTAIGTGTTSQLAVTSGVLQNSGVINVLKDGGGARVLNASLSNLGNMRVLQPLTMGGTAPVSTNSGTIDVSGGDLTINQSGGSFTNSGTINVGPGFTWTLNSGAFTHQDPGSIGGAALVMNSVSPAAFNAPHTLSAITLNNSDASFLLNQNTDVTTFTFTNANVSGPGTFSNSGGKTVVMTGGKMNADFSNNGLFTLRAGAQVNGALTTGPASTLRVEGDASYSAAFVTIANGFTNNGLLQLTSVKGATTASLAVTTGTLVNAGTIDVNAGAGGARALDAVLNNQATMTIGLPTTVTKSSAVHTNAGTITLAGGDLTFNQSGGNPSFTNAAGGSIDIQKSQTFKITAGNVTNAVGAKIMGEGTFDVSAATFFSDGDFSPGESPGILTIAGTSSLGSNATVSIELGGPGLGTEYDQLRTTGTMTLSGTLNVTTINAFNPAGNTFIVVNGPNGGSRFGAFNVPPGCQPPSYTSSSVTIVC